MSQQAAGHHGSKSAALQQFLSGEGRDASGRSVETVLGFDDGRLEAAHDYIQWLFPLLEPSAAVPGSPFLDAAGAEAIRTDAGAARNIDRATALMRGFYSRNAHWLVPHDHNHLRITRIIRSLRLLRGDAQARAFFDAVMARVAEAGWPVSRTSLTYWREALRPPA